MFFNLSECIVFGLIHKDRFLHVFISFPGSPGNIPLLLRFKESSFGKLKILHGEPGPTIIEYANKEKVEMVIIGSRGLNALQEMVLGSVSHKVVKRVHCPLMIIK